MNALGNRHVGKNLRILLVNNGKGTEFFLYQHRAHQLLQDDVSKFVAADGHYGQMSPDLVKNYCENLGFTYLSASNKDEVSTALDVFLDEKMSEKPILLEVFTDSEEESNALFAIRNMRVDFKKNAKEKIKDALGEKGVRAVRNLIKK